MLLPTCKGRKAGAGVVRGIEDRRRVRELRTACRVQSGNQCKHNEPGSRVTHRCRTACRDESAWLGRPLRRKEFSLREPMSRVVRDDLSAPDESSAVPAFVWVGRAAEEVEAMGTASSIASRVPCLGGKHTVELRGKAERAH